MRTRNLIAGVFAMIAMAACGGNDGINEPETIAGKYVLKTVNNQPMPFVVFEEPGYKLEVTYSDYVLSNNGTFTNNVTWRETDQGVVTTEQDASSGTYTANGSTLSFVSPDGDPFQGTLAGNKLTVTVSEDGLTVVAVYEK